MKKIVGHNFSLKFPLLENCKIPFSPFFSKSWKLRGKNNVRFDYNFPEGYVRQTNKSLIIFPVLEVADALPKKSYEVRNRLAEKAIGLLKKLQAEHVVLRVGKPDSWKPSTQEYAVEDEYAKSLDKTVENEFGKIDKSRHVDESGHVYSGGEIDWKSPEFADTYIRMPIVFMEAIKMFEANMSSHVKAIKQIGDAADSLERAVRPKRQLKSSMKKSATLRGVS